jgi:hypothetical protein
MPAMSGHRFLVVTWEGGGNLTPVMGLGPQLLARGHTVAVLARESLRGRVEALGMDFVPQASDGWLPTAADLLATVEADPPDALVVDFMLPSALSAAERTGLPTAALVHTLYAPVADNSFPAIEMEGPVEPLNALRADLGLSPVGRVVDVLDGATRVIAVTTAGFDGPAAAVHPHARYVGPALEGAGADDGWTRARYCVTCWRRSASSRCGWWPRWASTSTPTHFRGATTSSSPASCGTPQCYRTRPWS